MCSFFRLPTVRLPWEEKLNMQTAQTKGKEREGRRGGEGRGGEGRGEEEGNREGKN